VTKIAIFDYGAGNLFSLKSALERNEAKSVTIIYDLKELPKFDGLVLPGVGNFDPAISIKLSTIACRCWESALAWRYSLTTARKADWKG
jgi:glutamine amidotransferase